MFKSLSGFINELKTFVVCESGFLDELDIVQTMLEKGMFEIPGYKLQDLDYHAIYDNIKAGLMSGNYTEEEVMGYILKYFFGFKNKEIYDKKLYIENDHYVDCAKLSIRRVERIYMNLKRRQFIQPCYTKLTFTKIGEIVGKPRLKAKIKALGLDDMDVDEFPEYYFTKALNNKLTDELNDFKELLSSLKPELHIIDTTEFPWSVLVELNRIKGINSYRALRIYLGKNKLTMKDIMNNIDLVVKVAKYNMKAFISDDTRFKVAEEKFINKKILSNITVEANNTWNSSRTNVSLARVQQLYNSLIKSLFVSLDDDTFLFDGFELLMDKRTMKFAFRILNDDELNYAEKDVMNILIPNASHMTLRQLNDIIYENPLMHNIILYGYDKGLVVSNQDLRMTDEVDKTPILPEFVRDMKMSVRSTGALIRNGYQRTSDLILLSYNQLHNLKNIGKKSADEIIDTLRTYGVYITNKEENIL